MSNSPTNMPVTDDIVAVVALVATATVRVTAAGSAMRPACPTSCCSSSVALRTPACISVRFQIVFCELVIWSTRFEAKVLRRGLLRDASLGLLQVKMALIC